MMEMEPVPEQPEGWEHFKEAGFDTVKFLPVDEHGDFHCLLCGKTHQVLDNNVVLTDDLEYGVVYPLCYVKCHTKPENSEEVRQELDKKIEEILENGERVEEHKI